MNEMNYTSNKNFSKFMSNMKNLDSKPRFKYSNNTSNLYNVVPSRNISTSIPMSRTRSQIKFNKSNKVLLFDRFENILKKKSEDDFKCCYNMNRFEKCEKSDKSDNKNLITTKKSHAVRKININVIFDNNNNDEDPPDEKVFRETFLTKMKNSGTSSEFKERETREKHTQYIQQDFGNQLSFKEIINEVSNAQKKINEETEDLKRLLDYTKQAKEKIKREILKKNENLGNTGTAFHKIDKSDKISTNFLNKRNIFYHSITQFKSNKNLNVLPKI